MNWKRALIMAAVNLAAAVPMILLLEARDARLLRQFELKSALAGQPGALRLAGLDGSRPPRLLAVQNGQSVTFDPCEDWVHYPVQVEVVYFGNMPVASLVGWRLACRPHWTLTGWLMGKTDSGPPRRILALRRRIDAALCVLIFLQWIVVAGLPLARRQRFWTQPGVLITTCTVIAAFLALIRPVEGLAKLPTLLAGFAWIWWLIALVLITIRFAWRRVVRH